MVVQVPAHARQMRDRSDAEFGELRRVAHSGTQQQMWRVQRAARQDDFTLGFDSDVATIVLRSLDSHGAPPFEENTVYARVREYREVPACQRWLKISRGRGNAPAMVNGTLPQPDAFGIRAGKICAQLKAEAVHLS